jgi:hypothetical protein
MHEKNTVINELIEFSEELFNRNFTFEEIEKELLLKTNDEQLAAKIIRKLKKIHHEKRRNSGVIKLILGGVILIISFVITVFCFHSNVSFHAIMYSMTSVGCLLLFWGLYEIIG